MLTLYTKNNCGYCLQAKAMFKNNDIPFEEVNIEKTDIDMIKMEIFVQIVKKK